jgi:WD40 repeat protein
MVAADDGKTLITNNGSLQRYELASGKALYPDTFDKGHRQEVEALVFSADSKRLASSGADGTVLLWNLTTGQPVQVWRAHEARRPVRLWRWIRAGVQGLDMTPDGRWIASAGSEERVRVWDSATGKEVCSMTLPPANQNEHDRLVYHLRVSPEGKQVTALYGAQGGSFSSDGPITPITDWRATWDLPGGGLSAREPLEGWGGRFSGLSRDARTLVVQASIVNLRTGKKTALEGVKERGTEAFVLSPDGSLIAGDFSETRNNVTHPSGVVVWETATGKIVARLKSKSWSGQLLFHPTNRFLAVNDLDGIHLWDVAAAKKLWTRKLPERVRASTTPGTYSSCFAFTPDGRRMGTGHTDGTILLWDVELPVAATARLDAKDLDALWADLHDSDAGKAWRAVWRLAEAKDDVVPLVRSRLRPVAPAPADVTTSLLGDLGSDIFAKREAASKRLKELGVLAEKALRDRLSAQPTLELRQRIEPLLKAIEQTPQPLDADSLRDLRAVAVLAAMRSPEAREILEALTRGVPSAPLTTAASAALVR